MSPLIRRARRVLTEELLAEVFALRATVVDVGGAPVVVPDRVRV